MLSRSISDRPIPPELTVLPELDFATLNTKSGTQSGTKSGTKYGTQSGTKSGTGYGNQSGTRSGTKYGTQSRFAASAKEHTVYPPREQRMSADEFLLEELTRQRP